MSGTPLERHLTLQQLRVFKEVVDRGGFTRAAEVLSLSQPGVSHQMQALAAAVGHPLFHATRRGVELTAVGQAVRDRAGRILALVGETSDAIDALRGLRAGRVSVAGDTTVGIYVLPDAFAWFRRANPGVSLRLDVCNRTRVREQLLAGEADLGVLGRLWPDKALHATPFLENELMCFSAPDHPLAGKQPLHPADLLDGPLLLREPGSGTRETAEEILREHGVEPVAAMEMASNGALKRAVAGGLGVTVLSMQAVRLELAMGLLQPLTVSGFPVRRLWHVAWAHERVLSPAAQAFRTHLLSNEWRAALTTPLSAD
jgi:DNA-binding transcriptional LysR family regulator